MKKLLLSLALVGLAASAFGQAQIVIDNTANTSSDPAATTGGLFFLQNGATASLITGGHDFGLALYGGTDSANLSLIKSFSGATAAGDGVYQALQAGTFLDPAGQAYNVPGTTTASTTAFFQLEAWFNPANTSYAAAVAAGDSVAKSGVFANPVFAGAATPTDLTGMPAMTLTSIPEPSSFALAGLGAAALLIFRRRK